MLMKAYAAMGEGRAQFIELPVPEPAEDEALVKIEGCVICNTTDQMVINMHFGAPGFPVVVGHESVGRVIKTGSKVKNLKPGDRVTRANAIPSGYNGEYYSAWGGFAEYGIVKDKPAVPGFGDLPLEKAGLLIALSETASCIMQLESIEGKDILVTGTGVSGLSLVYFSKKFGAGKVICTGRRAGRLELAKKLGADQVYLDGGTELAKAMADGLSVDYVFEATGKYDVFKDGIPMLKNNGSLIIYGVPEEPYVINEAKSPAVYSKMEFAPKEDMAYEYVCGLLQKDDLLGEIFMTHRWSFDELDHALDLVRMGEVIKGMVVME